MVSYTVVEAGNRLFNYALFIYYLFFCFVLSNQDYFYQASPKYNPDNNWQKIERLRV